jgi:dTDP-4-dehydrorhamnose reductase
MNILILGASGFLGSILHKILSADHQVVGTTTSNGHSSPSLLTFNYTNQYSLQQLLTSVKPDCVINCIALADVDFAELNEALALKLNFELPRDLSSICELEEIRLIHISTDHFESSESGLRESDVPIPVNIYGRTKLLGDIALLQNSKSAVVVRTNFFGRSASGKKGLVDFVDKALNSSESIFGYENITFNPVGAHFLGSCIHKLIHTNYAGILNVASPNLITKFEFLRLVAKKLRLDATRISPRSYSSSYGFANRPHCMVLNTSQCEKFLGVEIPTIEAQLAMELSGTLLLLEIEESQ